MKRETRYLWCGRWHRLLRIDRRNVKHWTRNVPDNFKPLRAGRDSLVIADGQAVERRRDCRRWK